MIDLFPFVTKEEWALISNDHYNFYLRGKYNFKIYRNNKI